MRSVSLVQTTDRNVNQLQQNILQALRPLLQSPLLNGVIVQDQVLSIGDNVITHGLDRPIQGWFPCRVLDAACALYEVSSNSANVTINSDAVATIDLYVF